MLLPFRNVHILIVSQEPNSVFPIFKIQLIELQTLAMK